MQNLNIAPTVNTPAITCDPAARLYTLQGESRPENVKDFYDPIMIWLDEYMLFCSSDPKPVTVDFKLVYFNSSSAKCLLNILKKFGEFITRGIPVTINWHYEEDDEDMKDAGEEMSRIVKVSFNYIETN
jgi:hypothetical protein